jgi:methionyl-tRNA formyltransferase
MRACFIGTVEFSKQALNKLLDVDVDICGVVTNSENTINSDYADLRPVCLQHSIDVLDTQNINSLESIEWLSKKNPDVIFCFGWSQLIKQAVLNIPKMGVIGFHPTLLPLNRGRHPIVWALSLGLDKTGSTFFFMDEGADSGDILSQKIVNIYQYDDAKSLYDRIIETALHQIDEFSPQLKNQTFNRTKQDHSKANTWRKRGMKDGEIDFRMSNRAIYNLVRALSKPYVGAHVMYGGDPVKIWEVSEREDERINLEPGLVLDSSLDKLIVKTSDGAIMIEKHEFKESPKVGEYL